MYVFYCRKNQEHDHCEAMRIHIIGENCSQKSAHRNDALSF